MFWNIGWTLNIDLYKIVIEMKNLMDWLIVTLSVWYSLDANN